VQVGGGASGEVITASQAEDMKLMELARLKFTQARPLLSNFLGKILNFTLKKVVENVLRAVWILAITANY
jgi:hypothetical protein